MRPGDIVIRTVPTVEGNFQKGTRAIVKEVLNDREITLEGHQGIYLKSSFQLERPFQQNGQVSDLESIEHALHTIDVWNRTHPTGLMISIEAYPAQDGGSLFHTDSFDSNDVSQMVNHLLDYASNLEKAAMLERAAAALRFGV
jgi:methionine synthase I (cobalamin-dependent)